MAEEEKTKKESTEGQETAASTVSKKTLILTVVCAVLLALAIGTPLTVYLMSGPTDAEIELERISKEIAEETKQLQIEGFAEEDLYEEGEERLGVIYPFQTFIVNLVDGGYLRVQVQIEFVEQVVPKRFYQRLVPVEDALIALLSKQKKEDLVRPKNREQLKTEIREEVNKELRREEVRSVFFTQFIVQ